MLPPVSAAHHNRESVDYIAGIPHFDFFVRVTYLPAVPLSLARVVVPQPSTPRHVTVPVNPLVSRTVIKHAVNVPIQLVHHLAYQSKPFARNLSQSIPDISTKIPMYNCNVVKLYFNPLEYLRVRLYL